MILCSEILATSASLNTSSTQRNHRALPGFSFPASYPRKCLLAERWGNPRAHFICFLSPGESLQPTVCYPTSESCCFMYFVPYSSCLQQEGEFAPSNFTRTESRCYSFSRNALQYIEHSNILHVHFLRVLQRKILCLETAPPEVLFVPAWGHAFRDYTFYSDRPACLTFLATSYSSSAGAFLNRVSFARRAASQTLRCRRLARQPSEETGEHVSHPPPQSKGWRMGDKWRSRLV